jgi:Gpi18-like mannosyltransferase
LLAAGLVLRLGLAFLPGFGVDMGTFEAWSRSLADHHPWNFYNEVGFTDYAPGYMYVLWVIGEANQTFHFTGDQYVYMLKLPSTIADIASAYLLYRILENEKPALRFGAVAFYVFFPAALLIGPIWGQVDSLLAFFLLLAVYWIARDKPLHGAIAYTIGFLIKPQAIAALPFLAFWILRDHYKDTRTVLLCTFVPLALLLVLITPFFEYEPWRLFRVLYDATNVPNYRVNSFWAYNFWNFGGLFEQGFRCDVNTCPGGVEGTKWFGIATRYWGTAFFAGGVVLVIASLRNARGTGYLALGVALSVMVFYLFLTRMHERYIFAAFLPFLAAAVMLHSRLLWAAFAGIATIHFLNLYHVYNYYYPYNHLGDANLAHEPSLRWEWLYDWLEKSDFFGTDLPLLGRLEGVQVFSILIVGIFLSVLVGTWYHLEQRRLAGAGAT